MSTATATIEFRTVAVLIEFDGGVEMVHASESCEDGVDWDAVGGGESVFNDDSRLVIREWFCYGCGEAVHA